MTEVGRISNGEKDPERGFPRSTDYFIVRSRFAQRVTGLYGEKPTELPIFFYSDDFNEVCSERLEIRNEQGKLYGYGDGATFYIWNVRKGDYTQVTTAERPDIMAATEEFLKLNLSARQAEAIKWTQVLTIRFVIKDIPVLGYWQFTTKGSKTSIPNLRDMFDNCLQTLGSIRFFPLLLTIKKVKSNNPGAVKHYPVVDLIPQFSLETGLKISEYLQQHPEVNQARLALSDLSKGTGLLLGDGTE
ncbi:hypothetical protein GCM10027347_44320 [Larkinella harenae]